MIAGKLFFVQKNCIFQRITHGPGREIAGAEHSMDTPHFCSTLDRQ
jgi:hypothetical protein